MEENALQYYCEDSSLEQLMRKSEGDAGYDIRMSEHRVVIQARESALISTGLHVAIPKGYVGIVKSRSGLACKQFIEVGAGVLDSNYRGELKVLQHNHGDDDVTLEYSDRIAQLCVIPVYAQSCVPVGSLEELGSTDRGDSGFGSSGLK